MHGQVGVEVAEVGEVLAAGGAGVRLEVHVLGHDVLVQLAGGPEVHGAEGAGPPDDAHGSVDLLAVALQLASVKEHHGADGAVRAELGGSAHPVCNICRG